MEDNFKTIAMNELKQKQGYSLEEKINYSKAKIAEFVEKMGGEDKVFVSFSGGKDSTVLLHLVRSVYPNVKAVFMNTGLEYPEIVQFVKTVDNVVWKKPRKTVTQAWSSDGIPAVSKEVSNYINDVRTSKSEKLIGKRLNYRGSFSIPRKWIFLCDKEFTPYEISHHCCKYFKKLPSEDYVKETGEFPIVGTMANESSLRLNSWIRYSCNMYDGNKIQSRPLSIWTDDDIWEYIEKYNVEVCDLYYRGHNRTGCFLCPYGSHLDKSEKNKFELLKEQHQQQYKALDKLGIKRVLMDMNVNISNDSEYMKEKEIRQNEIKQWYVDVENDLKLNKENSKYWMFHKYFNLDK